MFQRSFPYRQVCKANIPTHVKFFIWLVIWGRILTMDKLIDRGMNIENRCVLCGVEEESMEHLFMDCRFSSEIWRLVALEKESVWDVFEPTNTVRDILVKWPELKNRGIGEHVWYVLPYAVMWVIWTERNNVIFEGGEVSLGKTVHRVRATCWDWLLCTEQGKQCRKESSFWSFVRS
ncbi:hypothetical protein ACHQM5_030019 [Ranunculus cassubicifolius]